MDRAFTVGVTEDLCPADGVAVLHRIGLSMLVDQPNIVWEFIPQTEGELAAEQIDAYDAIILLGPTVTRATVARAERLCLIARWGVGYDNVDVDACTKAGVLVTITPDGVRRPVASSAMAFILALAHRVVGKDQAARAGGWQNRIDTLGVGLTGRVLGVVGLGNIGREVLALARPFGMELVAADPYARETTADELGTVLVDLDELLGTADFVCLTCVLNPETYHLINEKRLAAMKPDAFLVNVARGGVVDQAALVRALQARKIAGAALDTLEREPPAPDEEILAFDNVILAPHSIAWTDELAHANTAGCCQAILDLLAGELPGHVVNPGALESPLLRRKLERHAIA